MKEYEGTYNEYRDEPRHDHASAKPNGHANDATGNGPRILSSSEFVRGFVPPDYVVDGILQRGFCYSLTAATGAGKTAITLRLLASIALGSLFGGVGVQQGNTLMLCGENPDDVRMRWIAMSEQMSFDVGEIDCHFIEGVFSIRDSYARIQAKAAQLGGLAFVLVDTSATYFQGDDENSNRELGDHARMLRQLTRLPGNPCVVANCHPTKNAAPDNLLPRGGGAFIAEVDGNLCLSKTEQVAELHWQGKFRGPDFGALAFEMITVTSPQLVDSKGRPVPTVIAKPLTECEHAAKADATDLDLQRLLKTMADTPAASIATLATAAGWTVKGGAPHKSKVARLLNILKGQKLVVKELNAWRLTPSGEKAAKRDKSA